MCVSEKTTLVIRITHSEPIEMSDFASSMSAFGNLFSDFCSKHGDSREARKGKLYLENVKHGSIEMRMVEIFSAGVLPLIENVNIIAEFAAYLKSVYDFFANGKGAKPALSEYECKEFLKSLDIVVNDNRGEMSVCAINDNSRNEYYNCTVYQIGGNAAQNLISKEAKALRSVNEPVGLHEGVSMVVEQMRGNQETNTGNKAVIDEIFPSRPLPLLFADPDIKAHVLHSEANPTRHVYVVDVKVERISGHLVYKVLRLIDTADL